MAMSGVSKLQPRYLCLWFDRLATDRVRPLLPQTSRTVPLVLFEKQSNALRIVALDAAAEAEGLTRGLMLTDARAQVPNLRALEAEPQADAAWLNAAAEACRRYTPALALDPPDGLMLNVTGAANLFGGESELIVLIEDRFRAKGFSLRCGLADTPALAWAMARFSDRALAEPGERQEIFAPLPVEALGLGGETVHVLRRLGLRTVGQLLSAPRGPIAKRLGEATLERIDQALGRRPSALELKLEIPPYLAERRLAEPMAAKEEILLRIRRLAARIGERLEGEGLGARGFRLELHRVDGATKRLEVWASLPLRDPARVAALFDERIEALNEGLEADYGFDLIRLLALRPQAVADRAMSLLPGAAESEAQFAALIDRLSARLGRGAVRRLVPAPETRLPERSARALHFDPAAPSAWTGPAPRDEGSPLRPITLFDPPQPIEVMAEIPEEPPIHFTWRRVQHRVAAAEGPERIDREWGRSTDRRVRDYYRLEDEEGRRFWVFREGRYWGEGDQELPLDPEDEARSEPPASPAPRWFLHGLFA
jgi:protein ImuB